jgi:hypothetical protein
MVIFKRHVNQLRKNEIPKRSVSFAPSKKSKENDNPTCQQVAVLLPWIGLPNLEANLQQPDGWNNQDAPAKLVQEYIQKVPGPTRGGRHDNATLPYLHDFVTGRSLLAKNLVAKRWKKQQQMEI